MYATPPQGSIGGGRGGTQKCVHQKWPRLLKDAPDVLLLCLGISHYP